MRQLAVVPSDLISDYLKQGYSPSWLKDYYNPGGFFDRVYLLSPLEKDQDKLCGMQVIHTKAEDLARRLKELNIDLLRAYGGNWACAYACDHKVHDVPVIVSVHDSNPSKLYGSISRADIVFAVSATVRSLVMAHVKDESRVWTLPNRVDFSIMYPWPIDAHKDLNQQFNFKYKILHVGRRSREKNLDTLIKALAVLGDDYAVIAVGFGDAGPYKELAQALGVENRLFLIDALSHEELARYYSWCSCMCTPSRSEGFGMVFIEALACEALVITSDIAPLNEYMKHQHNGLLVKLFEDPASLAQMIQRGCEDQQLKEKIQKAARPSVAIFEKEHIERQEINFYQRILDMRNQRGIANFFHGSLNLNDEKEKTESYRKALNWIKTHTIPEQGIIVNSKEKIPYLEVTGYLIPTLIEANEWGLARSYAEFLTYMQLPNGAYRGPDGKVYVFDSGQVLRGLTAAATHWPEFREAVINTAEYVLTQIDLTGRIQGLYEDDIPQFVHVYCLPALLEAGRFLNNQRYIDAAYLSISYYKKQPRVLDRKYLTHFLAYIIDGFIDMGEADFVRPFVLDLFKSQLKDGRIPAYDGVNWVCSTGLAQLAIIAYKLGLHKEADLALDYVMSFQNITGGFFGSYGFGAAYFPKAEISWANKFFLDAVHLWQRIKGINLVSFKQNNALLNEQEWHKVICKDQDLADIVLRIKNNVFPVWVKPLLEYTKSQDIVLELGSGSGELAAIGAVYGRQMHLVDFSKESLLFAQKLFKELSLSAEFQCFDILEVMPMAQSSVDWVYSSGVLEHFSDEQIIGILKESKRLARKGVMSLVPNARSLCYRIGKLKSENEGAWEYGHEDPKWSMRSLYEAAGLREIQEYTLGTYHSLQFWGKQEAAIKDFFDQCDPVTLRQLNQGYLIFTMGLI